MIPFAVALSIYLIGFSLLSYACIFADPSTSRVAECLTISLPNMVLIRPVKYLLGEKTLHEIQIFFSEWTQVILYQILITASWSVVFTFVYPEISISTTVSPAWPHQYMGVILCFLCIDSWRRVFHSSPGFITYKTLHKYNHYPYDYILFFPKSTCPTLGIPKLPRSKFDRFSYIPSQTQQGRHIPRFDHYCGWVKNNIGQENYRYFLLFILIHFGMCLYGSIILYQLLIGIIDKLNLYQATFINTMTGEEITEIDFFLIGQYLTMEYFPIVALGILSTGMSIVLGFFLLFHLYITSRGMTTNEYFKWKQVRRLYYHDYKQLKTQNYIQQEHQKEEVEQEQRPKSFPRNIYDHGIIENFKEIIWPKSLYPSSSASSSSTPSHQGMPSKVDDLKKEE